MFGVHNFIGTGVLCLASTKAEKPEDNTAAPLGRYPINEKENDDRLQHQSIG